MASVRIDRGPITSDLPLREVDPEDWYLLMLARRSHLKVRIKHDCRCLVAWVQETAVMHERLGFQTADEMIANGLELDPDDVRIAVKWLRKHEPEHPIGLPEVLGKHGRSDAARDEMGRFARGEESRGSNATSGNLGRGRSYTLARLRRDRPELAERVEAGELSANAAAVEAGFRRRPTPLDTLRRTWAKASEEERAEFLTWIQQSERRS